MTTPPTITSLSSMFDATLFSESISPVDSPQPDSDAEEAPSSSSGTSPELGLGQQYEQALQRLDKALQEYKQMSQTLQPQLDRLYLQQLELSGTGAAQNQAIQAQIEQRRQMLTTSRVQVREAGQMVKNLEEILTTR